ncbi:hypothetical protein ACIBEJ_47590 [Nonomuraea sp. NPDC050790]
MLLYAHYLPGANTGSCFTPTASSFADVQRRRSLPRNAGRSAGV